MTNRTHRPATSASQPLLLAGIHSDPQTPLLARPAAGGAPPQAEPVEAIFAGSTPDTAGVVWLAFSPDHSEEEAARRFQERYSQPPRYIIESRGNLLLGPVPSEVLS